MAQFSAWSLDETPAADDLAGRVDVSESRLRHPNIVGLDGRHATTGARDSGPSGIVNLYSEVRVIAERIINELPGLVFRPSVNVPVGNPSPRRSLFPVL